MFSKTENMEHQHRGTYNSLLDEVLKYMAISVSQANSGYLGVDIDLHLFHEVLH